MKNKEESNALKKEAETLNKKLAELTEEELAQVSGGNELDFTSILDKATYPGTDYTTIREEEPRPPLY